MSNDTNEFNCPHCNEKINISMLANEEFTKNLEDLIEKRIKKDLLKKADADKQEALNTLKSDVEKKLKIEFEGSLKLLKDKVNSDQEVIQELRSLKTKYEIDKLEKEQEVKSLKDQTSLSINVAVKNALNHQKSEMDNIVSEKDLQIRSLKDSISKLERQSQQGSTQTQGEAGELLIEKALASEFPTDTVTEIKKGQSGADSILTVKNSSGYNCGSVYFEAKRTKEFSKQWIEKLKKDTSKQNANYGVLVTETMPLNNKKPHIVDGIWVVHFSDFITVTKVLRQGLITIAKLKHAELVRTDTAQIMFDYLISQKFSDTMNAMLSPIFKMSDQLETEKRAIQKQWAMREKMIEDIISNANNFHGHLVAASDGRMPSLKLISSIEQLNEGEKIE